MFIRYARYNVMFIHYARYNVMFTRYARSIAPYSCRVPLWARRGRGDNVTL